ncbi:terminase large subunit [Bacillus cereus]|uniref:terminase TerL endonuclease subunit n=1 Tax=Bacillus TaxID=1386 RepID=UPI000A3B79CB|nr:MULTISPECIES: terminase TerL endonuclease subunit [Bacillus]MEB8740471.1 terminase large subunit [Bacillus cereus]MEB8906702.1 terminase large subunit [Bacillus cereus]MEB9922342.1 terminase large subunit [Bacillus cereus]MEB9983176.1 terminase large subunit [Bacillus cereus]MEB9988109.1 terminase large subunit [Bacillus cereus]
MIKQKYVEEYIELYRSGKVKFNKERELLIKYLEKYVLNRDDLYFDDEMIEDCINFGEKWYFPLQPFQKFLIAFVFLFYKKNGRVFYRKFLWMLGRGGGKNGLMSVVIHFLISELHGIPEYNISVVANSEEQAKTSPDEVKKTVRRNEVLKKAFKATESQTTSKATGSVLKFRTSNGDTKDGLRDGAVLFDEIHQYESNKDVRVHISGLGKKKNPREFYIGTDGYVRDGFLDRLKEKAMKVLNGESRPNAVFPFICKLNDETEVDDLDNWELANPMLSKPLSEYAEGLLETIKEEYEDLEDDPSNREEFMTKRMNLPVTNLERSVAKWSEILATNRPFPDLYAQECIGALDFASIRDFAACGLLFRQNGEYIFKTHSFVRKEFVDIYYGYSKKAGEFKKQKFAPIKDWEERGLLTVVDEPTINPQHIVDWFVEMREQYGVKKIIADNFRMEAIRPLLVAEGFEIEVIRNPKAIHSLLAPRIEMAFANKQIVFDDNPLMRWYTQNVLVVIKGDGNKIYEKKEPVRRKTDGFQCFVHALYRADEIQEATDFVIGNIKF